MDGNPMTSKGAFAVLSSVNAMSDAAIKELHFKVTFLRGVVFIYPRLHVAEHTSSSAVSFNHRTVG